MKLVTLATAAETQKVSERTIRRWIGAGKLRAVKQGRTVYVSQDAVAVLKNTTRARPGHR